MPRPVAAPVQAEREAVQQPAGFLPAAGDTGQIEQRGMPERAPEGEESGSVFGHRIASHRTDRGERERAPQHRRRPVRLLAKEVRIAREQGEVPAHAGMNPRGRFRPLRPAHDDRRIRNPDLIEGREERCHRGIAAKPARQDPGRGSDEHGRRFNSANAQGTEMCTEFPVIDRGLRGRRDVQEAFAEHRNRNRNGSGDFHRIAGRRRVEPHPGLHADGRERQPKPGREGGGVQGRLRARRTLAVEVGERIPVLPVRRSRRTDGVNHRNPVGEQQEQHGDAREEDGGDRNERRNQQQRRAESPGDDGAEQHADEHPGQRREERRQFGEYEALQHPPGSSVRSGDHERRDHRSDRQRGKQDQKEPGDDAPHAGEHQRNQDPQGNEPEPLPGQPVGERAEVRSGERAVGPVGGGEPAVTEKGGRGQEILDPEAGTFFLHQGSRSLACAGGHRVLPLPASAGSLIDFMAPTPERDSARSRASSPRLGKRLPERWKLFFHQLTILRAGRLEAFAEDLVDFPLLIGRCEIGPVPAGVVCEGAEAAVEAHRRAESILAGSGETHVEEAPFDGDGRSRDLPGALEYGLETLITGVAFLESFDLPAHPLELIHHLRQLVQLGVDGAQELVLRADIVGGRRGRRIDLHPQSGFGRVLPHRDAGGVRPGG